jgi:hypothetical protein
MQAIAELGTVAELKAVSELRTVAGLRTIVETRTIAVFFNVMLQIDTPDLFVGSLTSSTRTK